MGSSQAPEILFANSPHAIANSSTLIKYFAVTALDADGVLLLQIVSANVRFFFQTTIQLDAL